MWGEIMRNIRNVRVIYAYVYALYKLFEIGLNNAYVKYMRNVRVIYAYVYVMYV